MAVLEKNASEMIGKIRAYFGDADADIKVMTSEEYTGSEGGQILAWSDGPEEWALDFSEAVGEKKVIVEGWLLVEPVNGAVLGMYEA